MPILKRIFADLKKGKNITWVATIILWVIAMILNTFGILAGSVMAAITVTMLGLVATGFLVMGYRIEEILESKNAGEEFNTIQLLSEFPDTLDRYLKESNEILMLGLVLRGTTYNNYNSFLSRVKSGLKIRALIVNPHSLSIDMEMVSHTFSREDPHDVFASEIENILKRYRDLRAAAHKADNVQVGLLEFVPPFSLYIFPREKNGGKVFVQIYAYRPPENATPYFVISQKENPIWFKNFCDLYEIMWEDAAAYFSDVNY
jgi:hypothetical protein